MSGLGRFLQAARKARKPSAAVAARCRLKGCIVARSFEAPAANARKPTETTMSETTAKPYKVRSIRVVAKGVDVLVREYTLDPGEAIPWHRHSEVSDYYYGLEGVVVIETRDPQARHEVGIGQVATVTPPTVHHVSNSGRKSCRFLLIQGVGKYDFVKVD